MEKIALARATAPVAALVAMVLLWFILPAPSAHARSERAMKMRQHIKKRVKRQIGAPYAYGGMSPRGFDCSGLTRWTFKRRGPLLPHNAAAQFALAGERGARRIWKRTKLRKGDLVFFDTTGARVGHAGVYIGKGRFVSATSSRGVRRDSVWDGSYWGPRFVGGTRLRMTQTKRHSTGR
jgi:cell wall-associated NlpC family hydrolase